MLATHAPLAGCRRYSPAFTLVVVAILACQSTPPPAMTPTPAPPPALQRVVDPPGTAHPEIWPVAQSPLLRDPQLENAVSRILDKMSLEEKVGQVLQPSITTMKPEDVKTYHLGSVLNGGGGWPTDVRKAKPGDWLALADAFYLASMDTSDGRQGIPIIWGSDAVHGHSNIVGATLFPHNIGLGATRNYDLIRQIGAVTAAEMAVTGIDWTFSPVVAVTRDDRWGRTYETYSEDPEIVRASAEKFVEGVQGVAGTTGFLGRGKVIGTAKHFLGDGGTAGGKDQGDVIVSETDLRDIHGAGYVAALKAGVQTVMISQSSWQGKEMHGNRSLLTGVLKGPMGFDGFFIGDWNGHGQVPGCSNKSCPQALNAGLDMFMVPEDWKGLYESTLAQARSGEIPISRLDDAVRRILRVKMRAGLFTAGKPSQRPGGGKFETLGSRAHRDIARQAVRESLVLLKNNSGLLPLRPQGRVLVAGDGADSISKQSGGWTLTWQGDGNSNSDFPGATSIWEGVRATVAAAGGRAQLSPDGTYVQKPDVAIVVFGENPYAEWEGDLKHIVYENEKELTILRRLQSAGVPVVSLFLSGRPLWVNPFLNASDAFVAAWLPGTESQGVADVLFSGSDGAVRHDFRGKLSFSWPKLATQTVLNRGDAGYDPLFPLGFGLSYQDRGNLPALPVDTAGVERPNVFFTAGPVEPWKLHVDSTVAEQEEAGGRRVVTWSGGAGEVRLHGVQPVDLRRETSSGNVLAIDLMLEKAPTRPVLLSVGCGLGCTGSIDVTSLISGLPAGEWRTLRIPLRCFAEKGADMGRIDTPFRLSTDGPMELRFADIEVVSDTQAQATCP